MSLDKVAVQKIKTIVKNSDRLSKAVVEMENKVIDKGLELIEKSGIDPNTLPFDVRTALRGEMPNFDASMLLTPKIICAQPLMSVQKREETTRLINSATEQITDINTATSSISTTLNTLKEPIIKFQEELAPAVDLVNLASDIVSIIKLLPIPTSVGPVGQPNSVNNTFADTLNTIGDMLLIGKTTVNMIPAALSIMTQTINQTSSLLNNVTSKIEPFLGLLTMVKSVIDLQDVCPLVTQGDISNIQNSIRNNIKGQLAISEGLNNPYSDSSKVLIASLSPNATNPIIYKNFLMILEYNPTNYVDVTETIINAEGVETVITTQQQKYIFPSRRIKCIRSGALGVYDGEKGYGGQIIIYNINPQTNPNSAEGEYSFASDIRVLISEAQFSINVYTNNITLFEAPQIRNISNTSTEVTTSGLPTYVINGSPNVNLNSSPTDIEYGGTLVTSGLTISSFIQSGTIQVNSPVNIRLNTFGGIGDSTQTGEKGGGFRGFTESLLTIKRSTLIQDNVDPQTGRIEGFDQSAVDDWVRKYGSQSLALLKTLYETFQEDTLNLNLLPNSGVREDLTGMSYLQKLKFVRDEFDYYTLGYTPTKVNNAIFVLYDKSKPLLYNEDVLTLSKQLYGDEYRIDEGNNFDASVDYHALLNGGEDFPDVNWYYAARKNAYNENTGDRTFAINKAATLSMLWEFGFQITELYNQLFVTNGNQDFDGNWVASSTGLPIIPTTVGADNLDIEVNTFTQLAGRNETISKIVKTLYILGTYTYDLEIIDSLPAIGGAETDYPLNQTNFKVEDVALPPTGSISSF